MKTLQFASLKLLIFLINNSKAAHKIKRKHVNKHDLRDQIWLAWLNQNKIKSRIIL